jgi:hypothetical protein
MAVTRLAALRAAVLQATVPMAARAARVAAAAATVVTAVTARRAVTAALAVRRQQRWLADLVVLPVRVAMAAWEATPLVVPTAVAATGATLGRVEQAVRASPAPLVLPGHKEARGVRPPEVAVCRVRQVLAGSLAPRVPLAPGATAVPAEPAARALTERALRRACLPWREAQAETVARAVRPAVALAARVAPAARVATAAMDSRIKTSPMGLLALLAEAAGPVVRP